MSDEPLAPIVLVNEVSLTLERPIDDFPSQIVSIFGQIIPLIQKNGLWIEYIHVEHVGYTTAKIKWNGRFHANNYVEWIIRCWSLDRLETTLNLKLIRAAYLSLADLEVTGVCPDLVEEAVFCWCRRIAAEAVLQKDVDRLYAARSIYQWCSDEDLPGFSEHRLYEIAKFRISSKASGMLVTLRDEEFGPFTSLEISQIQNALEANANITLDEKAAFYLARDWGIRPIQISLLRTSDYGRDNLGPYVMIAGVKGSRRTKLRHTPDNLVKRYVSDDTARAVEAMISIAPVTAEEILSELGKLIDRDTLATIPTPIFCSKVRTELRLIRFAKSPRILKYVLHRDSHTISRMFRDLTNKLKVAKVSRFLSESDDRPLQISAYRFRRTKGTSMVLSGATPEEVAEALGHVNTGSVNHYFRYNLDLHDFVNSVHAASPEINTAVSMWQGRIHDKELPTPGLVSIGNLGKCALGAPCPHHPTVSCYACVNFRPTRDADHIRALKDIEDFQQLVASTSTGPISKQLEASIYGARSLIIAITSSSGNE